jgi:two-component system, NarL family, nitrate/nitrite response regulator NarL
MADARAPIRVMLVDDHRSVLWGLERLIEGQKAIMEVVGKATNGADALQLAAETTPDVVILDLDLAGQNGADIIPELVREHRLRVLILTGMKDASITQQAVLRGASGVVHKGEPAETILRAITKVHEGELWLDRLTAGKVFIALSRPKHEPDPEQARIASLTVRERQIVAQLAIDAGCDNKTLAEKLNMGEHTLRNHLSRIYGKLGVSNRLELYVFAQRHLAAFAPAPPGRI